MALEPTVPLAFVAGIASFASPCMLPVLPAFMAQLAGTSIGRSGEGSLGRLQMFSGAALFVAGFSLVFASLGVVLDAALAGLAAETLAWLSRLAGVVIIVLGLNMTGLLHLPALGRSLPFANVGPERLQPLLFGASFAVAWTPCVGPVLGSTLALAAAQPAVAFSLLLAYAVGLGAPFLLVGLLPPSGFEFVRRGGRWASRLHAALGAVLVGMGVLVFTGELDLLVNFKLLGEVLS